MLLSVIIPTYNRAHCIGRALASVALQEISDIEIIIGDDASTDETLERILSINPDAQIIRLKVNRGAAAARNAAMKIAKGEFLAFLDSDDEWLPGKIKKQLDYLTAHPDYGVCATGYVLESINGESIPFPGRNPESWRRELHSAQSFHGASTPVVRRSVLERVGLQDEELRVLEDWDWMLRISAQFPIHVLPETLAVIHENSPSDPNFTLQSMTRFLEKHRAEFFAFGAPHARSVVAQHEENTARTLIRHKRLGEGMTMLWSSWLHAPLRNPALLGAFPLALIDFMVGTHLLAETMARRNRRRT